MVIGLHRRRSFVSGNILWTPSNLATAPICWVNSDSPSNFTFSSGIKVSQWNDISGSNTHLTQSNAALQPDYLSSEPGVQFVRTSSESLAWANFNRSLRDFYFVAKIEAYVNNSCLCNIMTSGGNSGLQLNNDSPGGHVQETNQRNTQGAFSELDGGVAEIPGYLGYRLNDTTNYHLYSSAGGSTISSAKPAMGIFNAGTSGYISMIMKECIWLGYTPSSADIDRLEGYLAHRHSISGNLLSGHPYRSAPPYL